MSIHRVRVLLQAPVAPFELGVLHEVFGVDRRDDGVPAFDYEVCAEDPSRPFPIPGGVTITADHGLEDAARADVLALPSGPVDTSPSPAVLATIRAALDRGAYVLAVCTAAFTVAETGALDGQECAIHWRYAAALAQRYPAVRVNSDALYLQSGTVLTSAGTAAGIDACLHLVRETLGPTVSGRIARRMVVAPHRAGGQRQFAQRPTTSATSLAPVLDWLDEHLVQEHTLESIARRASVSPRTLLRRFRAETGVTPYAWLTGRRVALAQELLEATALSVEDVARRVGLSNATLLRHHFVTHVGIPPTRYRQQFRTT